jgi:eukaryotic-like serine/threonine-protein kinase
MYTTRFFRILTPVLAVCLVSLFVIAAPLFHASASNTHSSTTSHAALPAISTSCPAPGTARAASLPSLTLGTHPTIVYIVNEGLPTPTFGTLKRYDVVTGAKVEIVKMAGTSISEAQVSANGQWLLFVAHVSGQVKLQLIRMDGKFLQTLYCGNPSQAQWSTNQQLVLFSDPNSGHIYLLNMTTGVLQIELSFSRGFTIHPRTWLDNTRAYVTLQLPDSPPESVAILDTSKGPNQNVQNLQVAFDASTSTPFCWDFDSSPDATRLFISQCTTGPANGLSPGPAHGPSVITVRPPTGFSYSYLYVNQGQAFTAVRAVTSNTLLFTVGNTSGNTSQNGLWKVGTNGSNPAHLAPSGEFNQFSQFPWSNVSRDSSKYVLQIVHSTSTGTTYTLEYGSLGGGSPFVFASITNVQLATVGWTTM